jgi:hypothetical protein
MGALPLRGITPIHANAIRIKKLPALKRVYCEVITRLSITILISSSNISEAGAYRECGDYYR